uniref:Uncharacterized protein n=1 Tax=Glossina pallidipes TaxID=7398 RepID=A0A1B0A8K8_GLOPL
MSHDPAAAATTVKRSVQDSRSPACSSARLHFAALASPLAAGCNRSLVLMGFVEAVDLFLAVYLFLANKNNFNCAVAGHGSSARTRRFAITLGAIFVATNVYDKKTKQKRII